MLGELALSDQHLTAPAKSAAPADRVDVHAEAAGAAAPVPELAGESRKRRIQRAQSGSCPSITSAPMQALMTSTCSGLVMAEVIPAPMAIVRNALLMPSRFGRPKLMYEAPQDVFTLSSV